MQRHLSRLSWAAGITLMHHLTLPRAEEREMRNVDVVRNLGEPEHFYGWRIDCAGYVKIVVLLDRGDRRTSG